MSEHTIVLGQDGNAWMAHLPDFVNLQESPAGFGETPGEAIKELFDNHIELGETEVDATRRCRKETTVREITDHRIEGGGLDLHIHVMDEPGPGGANHEYVISQKISNAEGGTFKQIEQLSFQNGPIGEHGINGISNEVLLAIVIDRLRGFQSGKFRCAENAVALAHCEAALAALHLRTAERLARGVEGRSEA